MSGRNRRVAVIGAGISGNLVARLLCDDCDVTMFEANGHVGGHTQTLDVSAFGRRYVVDTGFMVFNRRTYPNFNELLQRLEIAAQPTDMSFSVSCANTKLEYQGSSLNGLFAQRANLLRPRFHRLLWEIARFNRVSTKCLNESRVDHTKTVGHYVEEYRFSDIFVRHYLTPMAAAIWSARPRAILDFPLQFFLSFFHNHGLLQILDRPQWLTVRGGARNYVQALTAPFQQDIRLNSPVAEVCRKPDGVTLRTASGWAGSFDDVVFATHANQTLRLLADPSPGERDVLSAFQYQQNRAVLHTDAAMLPRRKRAWASWNYHLPRDLQRAVSVTYNLSRLQRIATPSPLLLTLNDPDAVRPGAVIRQLKFDHPYFCHRSIAAQRRFHEINGSRHSYFCGAYWGNGFHEDGVNSALMVAKYFNRSLADIRRQPPENAPAVRRHPVPKLASAVQE